MTVQKGDAATSSLCVCVSVCVHTFFFPPSSLFDRKPECIVNILFKAPGNKPVALCLLRTALPACGGLTIYPSEPHRSTNLTPHRLASVYLFTLNPSQRGPAVACRRVPFRFLKPVIFNTSAQFRGGQAGRQAGRWLPCRLRVQVCFRVSCRVNRAPRRTLQFHLFCDNSQ